MATVPAGTPVVLFEDDGIERLGPILLTRPVFDLVVGAWSARERLVRLCAGRPVAALVRPRLTPMLGPLGLPDAREQLPPGRLLWLNGACLPAPEIWPRICHLAPGEGVRSPEGRLAAFCLTGDTQRAIAIAEGRRDPAREGLALAAEPALRVLRHSWDLVGWHETLLAADLAALGASEAPPEGCRRITDAPGEGCYVRGEQIWAEEGVSLGAPVALDARGGPILLRRGSQVGAFSTLEGPFLLGEEARWLRGRGARSMIGAGCRVRGEVEASVFLGWSNKVHAGFIGHSYVGAWVNLGALTTTSDLKNTYGEVRMWEEGQLRGTGLTKLGSIVGDHTRTAIGTLLASGSLLGVGVNLFGAPGPPPRWVPSFVWGAGDAAEEYDFPRFLEVAGKVQGRRRKSLTAGEQAVLEQAFNVTARDRRAFRVERG